MVPPPESHYPEAVLVQNRSVKTPLARCQVSSVPDFVFWFLCVFGLRFDENEVYFLEAMNCIFCSCFDCYIPSSFKESLCFLCWILHYFLCFKPLALFCRYYSLEWEIYISFSCVCFGLFWTWNVWVIHVVLSLSLLGWFLFPFGCWVFQCLVGEIGSSFQREVPQRSFSFLSLFLYS